MEFQESAFVKPENATDLKIKSISRRLRALNKQLLEDTKSVNGRDQALDNQDHSTIAHAHIKAIPFAKSPDQSRQAGTNLCIMNIIIDNNRKLFKSGCLSDALIVCQGREWKLHKAILAGQCEWFATAFKGGWKEAATGTVCLDEEDPKILDKILLYIYTGDIPLEKHQVNFVSDLKRCLTTLNTLISLRKLADFFLLAQLMRRIEKVFHYNLCTLLLDSYTISRGLRSPTPTTRNQLVRAVRRATEHAYGATHATNLQRMLAILLTALQEVLSPAFLDELSRDIDGLREDLFQLLLYKHYPAGFSATPVRLSSEGDHAQNADRRHCASCSARERVSMVLNPFSGNNVRRVFCHWCARDGIAKDFKMVLDAWANGDAQRKTATLKSETSIGRHEGAEDMSAWDLLPFRYGM